MQFPHCDSRILHAPGECVHCDEQPNWQELRVAWNINFTGHADRDKIMCPAEFARGDGINSWPGNIARKEDDDE